MTTRLTSAVVMATLALGSVLVSVWTFVALVIAAGVTVAWEWGRLVRKTAFDGIASIQAAAVAAVAVATALSRPGVALIVTALALGGTVLLSRHPHRTGRFWHRHSVLPAWSMVWLRADPTLGATALHLLVVA
jgi:CDP-diglyceride synthetase